jgi:pyruvate,water dikinase
VLVAETTAPPWTPLFATAVAIVTDTGGILSHCAVVAREYGIPAVVGTGRATTVFHDGELIEVDGDAGSVRRLSTTSELSAVPVVGRTRGRR